MEETDAEFDERLCRVRGLLHVQRLRRLCGLRAVQRLPWVRRLLQLLRAAQCGRDHGHGDDARAGRGAVGTRAGGRDGARRRQRRAGGPGPGGLPFDHTEVVR